MTFYVDMFYAPQTILGTLKPFDHKNPNIIWNEKRNTVKKKPNCIHSNLYYLPHTPLTYSWSLHHTLNTATYSNKIIRKVVIIYEYFGNKL